MSNKLSNARRRPTVVTDWAALGAMAHELRRRIFRLCSQKARSVGELAELLRANPGTVLYHVRRLRKVGLLCLGDTEKKRGVVEKRYRSVGQVLDFRMPVQEATGDILAPLLAFVLKGVHGIEPRLAAGGRAALAGHVAEARIGVAQQRIVVQRLTRLARYVASLRDDPNGAPMTFAAIFGPRAHDPAHSPTRTTRASAGPRRAHVKGMPGRSSRPARSRQIQ